MEVYLFVMINETDRDSVWVIVIPAACKDTVRASLHYSLSIFIGQELFASSHASEHTYRLVSFDNKL
jgi:hypothetical protein